MTGKALLVLALLIGPADHAQGDVTSTATPSIPSPSVDSLPNDGSLFSKATADAKQKMDAAEVIVIRALEKTPAYLLAKLDVAKQATRVEESKKHSDGTERANSVRDLAAARRALSAMVKQKLDDNAEYREAKKDYDSLIEVSKMNLDDLPVEHDHSIDVSKETQHEFHRTVYPTTAPSDRDPEEGEAVRQAMEHRTFRAGMTFDECCSVATFRPQQITNDREYTFCRWTLRGPVGSVAQTERFGRGNVTNRTILYGVVGYVHATFYEGRLASFERRGPND